MRLVRCRRLALLVLLAAPAAGAQQIEEGTTRDLLAPERIARLTARERARWNAYLATSRALHARDTAFMNTELRGIGVPKMRKARYAAPAFDVAGERDSLWFGGDSARLLADAVLTFQTPSGGWSKRTDMSRAREPGESYYAESDAWHYIPTLDNGATTGQLRFLARLLAVQPDARYRAAMDRGVGYLLAAQQPNGCWPQDFPLDGSYHDAITFNDDAVVNVLGVLDAVASGRVTAMSLARRRASAAAVRRGIDCLVATQVVVNGQRTLWGQQHDPLTLAVIPARRYELAGLSGRESAGIMTWLMTVPDPDERVVRAVRAAADWFRANAISGYSYDYRAGLSRQEGAGPIWARLTEIGTNRPIFANRDGVKLYEWNQLTDRRSGYAWFGTEPASALKKYDKWERQLHRGRGIRIRKATTARPETK